MLQVYSGFVYIVLSVPWLVESTSYFYTMLVFLFELYNVYFFVSIFRSVLELTDWAWVYTIAFLSICIVLVKHFIIFVLCYIIYRVFFLTGAPLKITIFLVSKFWHIELFWWYLLCNLTLFKGVPVKKHTVQWTHLSR